MGTAYASATAGDWATATNSDLFASETYWPGA